MFRFFRTLAITEAMQFTVFTLFCVKSTFIEKVHEKSVEEFGLRRVVRGLQVMGLNLSWACCRFLDFSGNSDFY